MEIVEKIVINLFLFIPDWDDRVPKLKLTGKKEIEFPKMNINIPQVFISL